MPSLVMHALFPLLPLLAFTRFPRRTVFLAWTFTFLPDVDYVVGPHRAALHNVFPVLVLAALWAVAPRVARLAPYRDLLLLAAVFWGGHEIMDVFYGGIVPFWPLLDTNWLLQVAVDVTTDTNTPLFYVDVGTTPGPPTTARVYPWFTPLDAAVLVATGIGLALAAFVGRRRLRGD